jgi:hypothetical protein
MDTNVSFVPLAAASAHSVAACCRHAPCRTSFAMHSLARSLSLVAAVGWILVRAHRHGLLRSDVRLGRGLRYNHMLLRLTWKTKLAIKFDPIERTTPACATLFLEDPDDSWTTTYVR